MSTTLAENGFLIPEIYLPKPEIDFSKWAVIACDQHTSNPSFWSELKKYVGDAPSTLNLIHPEVYGTQNIDSKRIHATMRSYLQELLRPAGHSPVYIRRYQRDGYRSGVLLALDLEKYSTLQEADTPVRASEKTIKERLPARIAIRRNAVLDLSHVLVLVNDPDRQLIEGLAAHTDTRLYDFSLSMGAGRISGDTLSEKGVAHLEDGFQTLGRGGDSFSIVGDGNHYLAAAKQIWEQEKEAGASENHPARRAMIELVNLHDPELIFKPIHRIVSGVPSTHVLDILCEEANFVSQENITNSPTPTLSANEAFYVGEKYRGSLTWNVPNAVHCVWEVERSLEKLTKLYPQAKIDYIHGIREAFDISQHLGANCVLLPPLVRKDIFPSIEKMGVLPKKAFSIGRAKDKRHYLEVSPLYV